MEPHATRLADVVLRSIADAYPQPVHFGYLGLALGVSSGAMLRALRELRRDGLVAVDRSLASRDVPYAQMRITGKGLVVSAGIGNAADDEAAALRRREALTLDHLVAKRAGSAAARVSGESVRPCP